VTLRRQAPKARALPLACSQRRRSVGRSRRDESEPDVTEPDLTELQELLGARFVTALEEIDPYTRDTSRAEFEGMPLGLVLAESAEDVSTALTWAHARGVPVSVRGAGTGLVGGAMAYDGGLIV